MSGFYESKGMVRYTMILSQEHKEKIESVAKEFKITQGEVVEVLIDQMNVDTVTPLLRAKREAKVGNRKKRSTVNKALLDKMKNLTPEQMAAIEANIAAISGTK